MFRDRAVKYQPIFPGFQSHCRFLRHLRLQVLHLGGGQVGRIGHDKVKFSLGQRLPVGEQIAHHRRRRLMMQGIFCVLFEVAERFRAFFKAHHLGVRTKAFHAQTQTAGAGAEVQHLRIFDPGQHSGGGFGHHLGISARAKHARPDRQLKVQKRPAAAEILQRLPVRTPGGQFFQPLRFLGRERPVGQPDILPRHQTEQLLRVEIGIRTACFGQAAFHFLQRFPRQHPFAYHLPSSGFSGRTGVTAAIATSIMLSSGSKTVRCCTQMPG